jgi:hypothetical protein
MIALSRAVLLIPILSIAAAAQPVSNWEIVKMLAPGTQIRVALDSSKLSQGKLASVTDSDLVLTQGTATQSFARTQILSVSAKKPGHRVRNTFIGLGIGTAVGIAIGVGLGVAQAHNCQQLLCGLAAPVDGAVVGAFGLVGGAAAGLVWPAGWTKIYVPPAH